MIRIAAVLAFVLVALVQPAAATPWEALVTIEELRDRLATRDLRIVDLRGSAAYAEDHADGAVSMPVNRWRAAAEEDRLPDVIGLAGIHPDRQILLVHYDTGAANFAEAAWIAWELKSRGIEAVSLLEGGMAAWREAGIRQTDRVHNHRTYSMDFARRDSALVQGPELEDIQEGLARIAFVSAGAAQESEGLPTVSLADLLDAEDALADRAGLLDRVKNAPVPWGMDRVVIVGDTLEAAPAFWFLASEILGIRDLVIAAPMAEDLGLARLDM